MNERRMIEVTGLLASILLVLAFPLWAAEMTNISGTILALNKESGTIVVGEVGPWRVKEGATEITPRTVAVTAGPEFQQVKRAAGAGRAGGGDGVGRGVRGGGDRPLGDGKGRLRHSAGPPRRSAPDRGQGRGICAGRA